MVIVGSKDLLADMHLHKVNALPADQWVFLASGLMLHEASVLVQDGPGALLMVPALSTDDGHGDLGI